MATDLQILQKAMEVEKDPRSGRPSEIRSWQYFYVGATREDIKRLLDQQFIEVCLSAPIKKYRLTEKGKQVVWASQMEKEMERVPAATILEAMDLIIGFDDVKERLAYSIEQQRKVHFLLQGPPACAKSLLLEAVRSCVPDAYMAFGSRTSASGLSEALFTFQPSYLLMDECDKMHNDVFSVLLGLMESGEIIETKSGKTRGIKLRTAVIGACNGSEKMPREFLSRFDVHITFPEYTRKEFIDVVKGFLPRAEPCPVETAQLIGEMVYDYKIGDIRKARGVWKLMKDGSIEEAHHAIDFLLKYGDGMDIPTKKRQNSAQAPLL